MASIQTDAGGRYAQFPLAITLQVCRSARRPAGHKSLPGSRDDANRNHRGHAGTTRETVTNGTSQSPTRGRSAKLMVSRFLMANYRSRGRGRKDERCWASEFRPGSIADATKWIFNQFLKNSSPPGKFTLENKVPLCLCVYAVATRCYSVFELKEKLLLDDLFHENIFSGRCWHDET